MYYFVFEQPANNQTSRLHDHIRLLLEDLKISKEVVKANPVQSPEELTREGLAKRHNTVVVVGSDHTINRVASVVGPNETTVLGIVPTSPESTFKGLLGIKNWQEACEILPGRRLINANMTQIGESYHFLTHVRILPGQTKEAYQRKKAQFKIDLGTYDVAVKTDEIVVANALIDIESGQIIKNTIEDGKIDICIPARSHKTRTLFGLFGSETSIDAKTLSLFHETKVKIESEQAVAVLAGNDIVAKTPVTFHVSDHLLKIIIKKQK
jgi:diacylglycerol kinase family enzyme